MINLIESTNQLLSMHQKKYLWQNFHL